jgi:hypothetical protein
MDMLTVWGVEVIAVIYLTLAVKAPLATLLILAVFTLRFPELAAAELPLAIILLKRET